MQHSMKTQVNFTHDITHSTIVGYTSIVYTHCLDLRQKKVGHPVSDSACQLYLYVTQ